MELAEDEKVFFAQMKDAYATYQDIVTSEKTNHINDIDKLARLIRCDLQNQPETARELVIDGILQKGGPERQDKGADERLWRSG